MQTSVVELHIRGDATFWPSMARTTFIEASSRTCIEIYNEIFHVHGAKLRWQNRCWMRHKYLSEDDVLAVEPRGRYGGDEELRHTTQVFDKN